MEAADERNAPSIHSTDAQLAAAGRAVGARMLETYDRLRADLPVWADLNDLGRLPDLFDPIEGLVAAIAELVPDYLDSDLSPLSEHRLQCLRHDLAPGQPTRQQRSSDHL